MFPLIFLVPPPHDTDSFLLTTPSALCLLHDYLVISSLRMYKLLLNYSQSITRCHLKGQDYPKTVVYQNRLLKISIFGPLDVPQLILQTIDIFL